VNRSGIRPSPLFLGLVAATVAGGALTVLDNDIAIIGGTVLLVLAGWGVSLCLHEFGHAYVAYRGGDRAVRAKGYLTLDPRHYTDITLSLILPLVLLLAGGIPLPGGAVWINHHALRNKRVESMVSLAGPGSNLVLGVLLSFLVTLISLNETTLLPGPLVSAISYLAFVQILAFVLNMLPVPGLDGWGVIEPWLSRPAREFGAKARPWAPLILFVVLITVTPVTNALFGLSSTVFDLIGGDRTAAAFGNATFMFWR
jgi:Zn-dependent protease